MLGRWEGLVCCRSKTNTANITSSSLWPTFVGFSSILSWPSSWTSTYNIPGNHHMVGAWTSRYQSPWSTLVRLSSISIWHSSSSSTYLQHLHMIYLDITTWLVYEHYVNITSTSPWSALVRLSSIIFWHSSSTSTYDIPGPHHMVGVWTLREHYVSIPLIYPRQVTIHINLIFNIYDIPGWCVNIVLSSPSIWNPFDSTGCNRRASVRCIYASCITWTFSAGLRVLPYVHLHQKYLMCSLHSTYHWLSFMLGH